MSLFSLEGKTALVTGASSGIGQAIAIALSEAGAHVICAGVSSQAGTVSRMPSGEEMQADLSDPAALVPVFSGRQIDILVNNAGIIRRDDCIDFSEQDWDDVMTVNLKAVFLTAQAFGKAAIAAGRPGKIVNIASLLSFQGGIRVPSYTASKHGVAGLTKLMANEWASRQVNVNAIAPGYIATSNTAALRADPARSAELMARIPAGRWGEPSDIAGAAVFLASPAADYIHGAILNVDGGWLAR